MNRHLIVRPEAEADITDAEDEFRRLAEYALQKNAELYRRLA